MGEITFRQLVLKIHPDRNPNITNASEKMTLTKLNKDNPKALFNLAVEWGLVVGTKNEGVTVHTGQKPRVRVNPRPSNTPPTGDGWDNPFHAQQRQQRARTQTPPTEQELERMRAQLQAGKAAKEAVVRAKQIELAAALGARDAYEDRIRQVEEALSGIKAKKEAERQAREEAERQAKATHTWTTSDGWKTPPKDKSKASDKKWWKFK